MCHSDCVHDRITQTSRQRDRVQLLQITKSKHQLYSGDAVLSSGGNIVTMKMGRAAYMYIPFTHTHTQHDDILRTSKYKNIFGFSQTCGDFHEKSIKT